MLKKSTKAALLSGLVFPGAGHLFLKKPVTAIILAGVSLAALYVIVSQAIERAQIIIDEILSKGVQPDMASITELVSQQSSGAETQIVSIATLALIIAWLIGIADAYRLGRKLDKGILKTFPDQNA